jgi:limonene-1,2-epoxide hydrolase
MPPRNGGADAVGAAPAKIEPENLLSRLHAAQAMLYTDGDATAMYDVLHADVTWHVPGSSAIAGTYHGIDEVLAYMRRRRSLTDASFRMHLREVLVGPTHFAAITDGTARIGGAEHRWTTVGLYQAHDRRIRTCSLIPFDQRAFDDIWQ